MLKCGSQGGETDPNLSRLFELAKILGVGITDFFTEEAVTGISVNAEGYGNINKGDIEKLNQSLQKVLKEINKLRTELTENEKTRMNKGLKRN